jgi:hypothetical protein
MKQKDMNMVMAAVAVLVMLKTMVNRTISSQEDMDDQEDLEEEFDETPGQVSDLEYEYLNDLLTDENFDFEQFKIEDFENLDFQKMMSELNSNLEVKLAIMKNSTIIKELQLKSSNNNDDELGEAISDS